jgi:hypothetical protein
MDLSLRQKYVTTTYLKRIVRIKMNDQDLRDCFAMLRAITGASAEECYAFADEMLEARKPKDVGIKAVKKQRKTNDEI